MGEPPAKRQRLDMSETFVVCVGSEAKEFIVYKNIATRSSKLFKAAMDHDWKESQEKKVSLPGIKVHQFEGYLQWLNTGDITCRGDRYGPELARLYTLGDFLVDPILCKSVLQYYIGVLCDDNQRPSHITVRYAWQNSMERSPLRKLVLESYAIEPSYLIVSAFQKPGHDFSKEFIMHYLECLVESRGIVKHKLPNEKRRRHLSDFVEKLFFS